MIMKTIVLIVLFCSESIHFLSKKIEEYRRQAYYSFILSSRFIMSPVRYFTVPYFHINVPTYDHVKKFNFIKQLKQEIKSTTDQKGSLSQEEGFRLIRETASKSLQITEIIAPINFANYIYAQQHDQLTLLEKVFTDRQKELDQHLRIVAKEYQLLSGDVSF